MEQQLNELFETLVQQRVDEAIKAKYRAQFKKNCDANREKINLYNLERNKEYYQLNKERLNKLRVVNRRKAKAKQLLQVEEETLAKT